MFLPSQGKTILPLANQLSFFFVLLPHPLGKTTTLINAALYLLVIYTQATKPYWRKLQHGANWHYHKCCHPCQQYWMSSFLVPFSTPTGFSPNQNWSLWRPGQALANLQWEMVGELNTSQKTNGCFLVFVFVFCLSLNCSNSYVIEKCKWPLPGLTHLGDKVCPLTHRTGIL